MTKEEVINMAHDAGVVDFLYSNHDLQDTYEFLQQFAEIVATKEREACARILDSMKESAEMLMEHADYMRSSEYERMVAFEDAAEAIKNRSKEHA